MEENERSVFFSSFSFFFGALQGFAEGPINFGPRDSNSKSLSYSPSCDHEIGLTYRNRGCLHPGNSERIQIS